MEVIVSIKYPSSSDLLQKGITPRQVGGWSINGNFISFHATRVASTNGPAVLAEGSA